MRKFLPKAQLLMPVIALLMPSLALATSMPAAEAHAPRRDRDRLDGSSRLLLLQVILNGQQLREIVRAERSGDGRLVLSEEGWKAMRLRPLSEKIAMENNRSGYALESLVGARYSLDIANMLLTVSAPPDAFENTIVHPGLIDIAKPRLSSPGVYLNYDLSTTHTQNDHAYGAFLEGVGFNGWGSAVASLVARGNSSRHEVLRSETYWQKDLPSDMQTLAIGDAISSSGSWSRPARYAGVRWARDFSLQPGYITFPMPTINGSAALPSTIDLLINNQRTQSSMVTPGPFQLSNVPVITGAGEINLIVRDALGVERLITQRYYASPRLLAQGFTDFSLEAGSLRRDFLLESDRYTSGFVAGSLRYGIHPGLTGEGRIEWQPTRQAAGIELAGLLGHIAVGRLAMAHANSESSNGNRVVAGIEHTTSALSTSLQWERNDAGYSPFAEIAHEIRLRERMVAGLGTRISGNVAIGVNYVDQTDWQGNHLQLASINLGVPLPHNIYLNAYASQRLDKSDGWSGGLSLVILLDGPRSASANMRRETNGKLVSTAEIGQSTPFGPGLGWRLRASDSQAQQLQAGATLNTNFGRFTAEANQGDNNNAIRLGANGSIGWLEGLAFATRSIGQGSFAVVRIADLPDVPVYRSHQLAATTNADGLALVPGLLPYHPNQITIDPIELPLNVEINAVSQTVVPYARSGTVVAFPVFRSHNALLTLQREDGTPVPEGARVRMTPSSGTFFVARRGEVYLRNLIAVNELLVEWETGSCRLTLHIENPNAIEPRLGPMICKNRPAQE